MTDLVALKAANAKRWISAKTTRDFSVIARHLVAPDAKERYQAVSAKTGVPWAAVAVIHERLESSAGLDRLAGAGRSVESGFPVHVPAGRGPFRSWEDAAIDALVNCAPHVANNRDWSIGGTLTRLEEYNGLGYALRGLASPYLWAGTDQYRSGHYIRDGIYDSDAIDSQPGSRRACCWR